MNPRRPDQQWGIHTIYAYICVFTSVLYKLLGFYAISKSVNSFEKNEMCRPGKWLIEAGESIGLDFSNIIHETTNEFYDHCLKRHGNRQIHGKATITDADFKHIPAIVKSPDYAVIGAIRKETLINAYAKIYNGMTYLYFEEVLLSRKNKALR